MCQHIAKDAAAIKAFLDALSAKATGNQRHWPCFVYHFTDIHNAVSIIHSKCLYSRNEAMRLGLMVTDNASPGVLSHTPSEHKDYARLYWRPRTPTQYRNEGIRPAGQRELGAHCPVPVQLLFDAESALSDPATWWCDGTMAGRRQPTVSQDVAELQSYPFDLIYHSGPIYAYDDKAEIFRWRQAEIVAPTRMELLALRYLYCRSEPERELFFELLAPKLEPEWRERVLVDRGLDLFERKWSYAESVSKGEKEFTLRWNSGSWTPGPFHVSVAFTIPGTASPWSWEKADYDCSVPITMNVSNIPHRGVYSVAVTLDGAVAYRGTYRRTIERAQIIMP